MLLNIVSFLDLVAFVIPFFLYYFFLYFKVCLLFFPPLATCSNSGNKKSFFSQFFYPRLFDMFFYSNFDRIGVPSVPSEDSKYDDDYCRTCNSHKTPFLK